VVSQVICLSVNQFYTVLAVYAVARPFVVCLSSVVCVSVTFVHPTQPVGILGNLSTPFGTLALR